MTPFVAVIALVVAVAIIELILEAKWNRAYFVTGIPIFISRVDWREPLESVPVEHLQKGSATAAGPPLVFHLFDSDAMGFHEQGFGLMHYAPLMRGVIRRETESGTVRVAGLVNWWFVALLIALPLMLGRNVVIFAPAVVAVFAILYLIQGVRFWRVARALRSATASA